MNGDFGPHSLGLIDLNSDGKKDLFFYAGFENIFSTFIYTANYDNRLNDGYHPDNFLKAYSNKNDYSVLIKPGNAGQPLILDSGYEGRENRSGISCFEDQSGLAVRPENKLTLTDSIRHEIKRKYQEVTGQLDNYNFDYNMPGIYPLFNSMILDPIKIFRIVNNEAVDVTGEYPNYLQWRIGILNAIREVSSANCSDNIHKTIKHLKSYL
ncbi:MAG: hypothetical protein R3222_05595 [Balneolaceae bacterium]|nr:hypothetical protein [Balneolaceae bacterium]